MALYAHITDDTIDQIAALPALWLGPTRWHDWRGDPSTRATQPADWGWLPVTETPRPDPIDGGIHESAIELVDGLPVRVWTWRPWTAEELAAREQADAERARYETNEAILDATAALMAAAHTDGEPWVQPTGAHNAVPLDITVTHDGKTWRSKHPANVWPPSSGSPWWEEVTDDPGPQPWALGTYYAINARVTFGGQAWRCIHEHLAQVGWEPGAAGMHAVWSVD